MNRIPNVVFLVLPYFLTVAGMFVYLFPDANMFRGTAFLVLLAGLGSFKLQMDRHRQKLIPNSVRNKAITGF